ncbi:MAG: hypothetical protein IJ475_01400 [Bacilli bacterium]|nr:hypothetical protein [Bacilli bacterium]
MMFGYDSLLGKLRKNSEENVKCGVLGNWYGDTLIAISITIILIYYSAYIPNKYIFLGLYVVLIFTLVFYIGTRKMALGLTKNNFVYIKFKRAFFKEKEVYEIPFDSIKYIRVSKLFGVTNVTMSFIANDKKFRRIKFRFSSMILGFSIKDQKRSSAEIYKVLREVEKKVDRGDF